jgi:two-component system, NarL family, sensor kinase
MSAVPAAGAPLRWRRWVALPVPVLVGIAIAATASVTIGFITGQTDDPPGSAVTAATAAVTFTPLGVFIMRRLPGHRLGPLMTAVGLSAAVAALSVAWSSWLAAAWLSQWSWWVPLSLIPVLLLAFPDGQLPGPRWRPLAAILVSAAAVATVALAAAAVAAPRTLLSPRTLETPVPPFAWALVLVAGVGGAVVLVATIGVVAALAVRWRRADAPQRRQLVCLAPSAVLLAAALVVDGTTDVPYTLVAPVVALPLGLTIAVVRYQLHDLDLYIHRGTVWLVLTGLAIGTYAVVVTALSGTVAQPGSPMPSLIAAGVVAALLQPAQRAVQRATTRLLYGRRDDPYAIIAELGRHLESVRDPLAVLPQIAATVTTGLRVPYAAVRMTDDDGETSTVAEHGRWSGDPERFAMVAHGRNVGELLVAPRRPGTRFTASESALLRDLAGQAALAAEACRSAVALARARDRLVFAREEERRRLRRDLHDGVASALVGTRMLAEVARRSIPPDGPAPQLLDTLAADLDTCTTEVRELIDGLRPAVLDDGLEKALTIVAERFEGQGPGIRLEIDGDLTELPAAAEVVAYRIVTESLTNVLKHAKATTATVVVRRDERHLDVQIVDDGVGVQPGRGDGTGVGLSSMRSRAEELGGRCEIRSSSSGTVVELLLPLGS